MKPALLLAMPLVFGLATANAAVNPALLALMPPDSAMLFGVQVQSVLASPFGQYAITQLPSNNGTMMIAAATGFDYQHDLQEILGSSNGSGSRPSLVVATGKFQPDKFLALATTTGAKLTDYNGTQIIALPETSMVLAFLDRSTAAFGSEASVQAAIDRFANHVQFGGPLADKANAASGTSDAWFATVTPVSQFLPPNSSGMPIPPNVLQQVREVSAGVRFNDMGMIAAGEFTTPSAQQAHLLQGVLQFVAAMAQSKTMPNPGAAQAAGLISAAQFSVHGTALDIMVPVPEQMLEKLYSARSKPVDKASLQ